MKFSIKGFLSKCDQIRRFNIYNNIYNNILTPVPLKWKLDLLFSFLMEMILG